MLWLSVAPGSTARSSAVRSPSQTIALPRSSSQWYATKIPSCGPRDRHGAVPAFCAVTVGKNVAPASTDASSSASQRTTRGPDPDTGLL